MFDIFKIFGYVLSVLMGVVITYLFGLTVWLMF